MPIPKKLSTKYVELFVDENKLKKIINLAGTMPADIRAIKTVLASKLADQKFMEGMINEYMQSGKVRF